MLIDITISDIVVLMIVMYLLVLTLLLAHSAHKQYMIGHNTWLFAHTTDIELRIQEAKINAIK